MENTTNRKCYATDKLWRKYKETYKLCQKQEGGATLSFHEEQKDKFDETFVRYYDTILEECMTSDTKALDIHKQAAISIVAALESRIVTQPCKQDEIAMGPYTVVLNVALSLLLDNIMAKLDKIGRRDAVKSLSLPNPFACETPYFEVMTRLLCYEDATVEKDMTYQMSYNIFEWAERFFLLEYITYVENDIDPGLMQEI